MYWCTRHGNARRNDEKLSTAAVENRMDKKLMVCAKEERASCRDHQTQGEYMSDCRSGALASYDVEVNSILGNSD